MQWLKEPTISSSKPGDNFSKSTGTSDTEAIVKTILAKIKNSGDRALKEYTEKFDGVRLEQLKVDKSSIESAYNYIDAQTLDAVKTAAKNIETFARHQLNSLKNLEFEISPGVVLGHRLVPVSRVGCYIPAGRYPLPSSALMSIIPAKTAGVSHVTACAPPVKSEDLPGEFPIHPLILAAMDTAGADEIYCMGGAQAIAAYAFGTESVPPVDMIVGPGNRFVVEAKRQLHGLVGIDSLAGPSEALIIADQTADAEHVAMDLLAKCEHDTDAVAILVTPSKSLAEETLKTMEKKLPTLETTAVAGESWDKHGEVVVCDTLNQAVDIANNKAPEHLQLMLEQPEDLIPYLTNYGSLFIGHHAPVAFGDYCSGTNHILPTNRSAQHSSGLWVGNFIKVLSYQKIDPEGAKSLADTCAILAEQEGLFAHKYSAQLRK